MALLSEKTITLINRAGTDLKEVSAHTGLSYDWLLKFKRGKIKDPSVNKVQIVYEHLSGQPLFAE